MRVIKQHWEFEEPVDGQQILKKIEKIGRVCYKTEDKINSEFAEAFVERIMKRGHLSVIEHQNISVRIVTDRGVTHEIVRHRLASYSQESTRYCNYSGERFGNELTIILPVWFYGIDLTQTTSELDFIEHQYAVWYNTCIELEKNYFKLLELGQRPEGARSILPNSLKTEIVMTCNLREWRHFFTLRSSKAAHPQMRELASSMLAGFKNKIPIFFDDIKGD